MIKKRILKILIAIIVILIIIEILFIFINKLTIKEVVEDDYDEVIKSVQNDFISEGEIVPNNYNFLTRLYSGEVQDSAIYARIYQLIFEYLQSIYELKDKTEFNIEEYYKQNEEYLAVVFEITNFEEFTKFFESIEKLPNINYVDSSFILSEYYEGDEYDNVDLEIQFEGAKITFRLDIIKQITSGKQDIKFILK